MRTARRIIFILFTAAYLIVCPLVLLYAFGYSVRPGDQTIVRTGLIYVSTMPPGATVHVERRRYTGATTPTMVRGLLPGRYEVRVGLPGYQPWSRAVPVEAEKSAVLDRILLIPWEWKLSWLLPGPLRGMRQVPGTKFLLVRRGAALRDHLLYEWRTGRLERLTGAAVPSAAADVTAVWSVPESPALLLRLEHGEDARYLWCDASGDEPRVEDLTGLIPSGARRVTWDPVDRRHLFILHEGRLLRLHLPTRTLTLIEDDVRGAAAVDRTLYVVNGSGDLLQADPDGAGARLLANNPEWAGPGDARKPLDVWAPAKHIVLLRGPRGQLFSPRPPSLLAAEGVDGLVWDPQGERALVWQKTRIGIVTWSSPPARRPELRWVYQDGRRITQAAWVYEGSHIIFHDADRVKLLELAGEELPRARDLFGLANDSPMAYAEGAGRLFYVDGADGALWAADVVPRRELLGFAFPEWDEPVPRGE